MYEPEINLLMKRISHVSNGKEFLLQCCNEFQVVVISEIVGLESRDTQIGDSASSFLAGAMQSALTNRTGMVSSCQSRIHRCISSIMNKRVYSNFASLYSHVNYVVVSSEEAVAIIPRGYNQFQI